MTTTVREKLNEMNKDCHEDDQKYSYGEVFSERLDGNDHERGQLEALQATVQNQNTCLGNLIELLINKSVITDDEVEEKVLNNIYAAFF